MNASPGTAPKNQWARKVLRGIAEPDRAMHKLRRGLARIIEPAAALPDHGAADRKPLCDRFRDVPEHLVLKVNGIRNEQKFREIGRLSAECIAEHLGPVPVSGTVLDFGCGLGRTLLALTEHWPGVRYIGFDIDPMMLEWGRYLLSRTDVEFVGSTTPLPDGSCDRIHAISVFTHLDETAEYWLAEILRLLKPTGKALLTFHGETLLAEQAGDTDSEANAAMRSHGRHVVGRGTAEGGALKGVYYRTEVWEQIVGKYFDIERTVARGSFGRQSFSVVSPAPGAATLPRASEAIHSTARK